MVYMLLVNQIIQYGQMLNKRLQTDAKSYAFFALLAALKQ
jgi:hypothetical protein